MTGLWHDTSDLDAIRRYQPLIDEIVALASLLPGSGLLTAALDELAVAMGSEIAGVVPG